MVVLIDERPEEVTDFRRTVPAEIYASSNDEEVKSHLRIAELAIERAKRLVESKKDAVLLLDSITALSRAYNAASGKGGRTMTGDWTSGVGEPRQFFLPPQLEEAGRLRLWPPLWSRRDRKWTSLFFRNSKEREQRDHIGSQSSRTSALAGHQLWPLRAPARGGPRDPVILEKTSFLRRAMSPMKVMTRPSPDRKNGNHPVKQRISRAHSNRLTH